MSRHTGGGGGQQPCHQMSHGGGGGSKIVLKSVTYYWPLRSRETLNKKKIGMKLELRSRSTFVLFRDLYLRKKSDLS